MPAEAMFASVAAVVGVVGVAAATLLKLRRSGKMCGRVEIRGCGNAGMQLLARNGSVMRVIGVSRHPPHRNDELFWSINVEYQ